MMTPLSLMAAQRRQRRRSHLGNLCICPSMMMTCCLLLLLLLLLLNPHIVDGSSFNDATTATKFPLPGVLPDPFVALAPLIVGVVCQDGVLLLACHTAFANDENNNNNNNNDESFLLLADEEKTTTDTDKFNHNNRDLPRNYRGPFRIYLVESSIAMTSTGWRTDGQFLAEEILQRIDQSERQMFGGAFSSNLEYATFLACQASQKMAEQSTGKGGRALSTVGLIAAGGDGGSDAHNNNAALWLVDATGAYCTRACAVGGGPFLSGQVNDYLRERDDFSTRKCTDVAREMLEKMFGDDNWSVSKGTRIEMMAVGQNRGGEKNKAVVPTLKRLFPSALIR